MKMKKIKLKKKNLSNKSFRWLDRHLNDEFVLKSKAEGFRSRSSYKLIEINKKYNIFHQSKTILDLGCSPGGWLQVAKKLSSKDTKILGIDILQIKEIEGVKFLKKDIFDEDIFTLIQQNFSAKIDLMMSDMSPNSSGNKSVDHLRIISLVERVLEISRTLLNPGGILVSKIFQGGAQGELITTMNKDLTQIRYFKPKSSRKESPETYLIAKKN